MKRYLAVLSLVAVATSATNAATPPPKATSKPTAKTVAKSVPKSKLAPADQYFGRLKVSIIGISNMIKDAGIKVERTPEKTASAMSSVAFAEEAIHDWEKRYPKDTWLPKTVFALERFYNLVPTDEGRAHAKSTMVWLIHDFPTTSFAKTGKAELAAGQVGAPTTTSTPDGGALATPPQSIDITKPALGASTSPSPSKSGATPASTNAPVPTASTR